METARTRALKQLATTMPVANQQVAQGMQAARLMGVQRAVSQAPTPAAGAGGTGVREVQAAGAQQAAAAGEIQVGAATKTAEGLAQLGQVGVAEAKRAGSADVATAQSNAQQTETADASQLSKLGLDVKQKLFDDRIKFARDEAGNKVWTESLLMDHAVTAAKSDAEFKSRMQTAQLVHERRSKMLEVAHAKIVAALEYESKSKQQNMTQDVREKLIRAKAELEAKMQREAADAANKQAMWSAGGTIVGGAIGALGGPAGVAAGAAIGGALGSYVGTQVSK